MGGTGSKQEDQIITVALERLTAPKKMTYVPFKGGGDVAVQLVGKHVDSSVNNPIEAVAQWRAGSLRPLCLFDGKRSTYAEKVTKDMAWSDIPTCKEAGIDVEYQMLRGVFGTPGISKEQVAFYVDLFKKVAATEDWKDYMEKGASQSNHDVRRPVRNLVGERGKDAPRPDGGSRFSRQEVSRRAPARTSVRVGVQVSPWHRAIDNQDIDDERRRPPAQLGSCQ